MTNEKNLPPGVSANATEKEIDAAGDAVMRKKAGDLTKEDQDYLWRESQRVLREL